MKCKCGAWYIRCEQCGKKNICPSCEHIRADTWSPMCERCERPTVRTPQPIPEVESETFQEMRGDTGAIAWRLCHDMVKHIGGELGLDVKVTRGRGWSTWASRNKMQVNIGIKCVMHNVNNGHPEIYACEAHLWPRDWDAGKAQWYLAVHELAHIYGAIEYSARKHDGPFLKAVKDLVTLFPYDEVMEAVQ